MVIPSNVVEVTFDGRHTKVIAPELWQYDYGQVLKINGLDLPAFYEVHFSNDPTGESKTVIGDENGALIPDEYLVTGAAIYAWLFLHTENLDGETEYQVTIPVNRRAMPTDEEPTPEEQSTITQLIAAAVAATESAEAAANASIDLVTESAARAVQSAKDAEAWAVGQREGVDVEAGDETYHNNARYYSDLAIDSASAAEASATTASTSETNAVRSAENASISAAASSHYADLANTYLGLAEQVAGTAGYMVIGMDENGHLIYVRTDTLDVDLSINADGHLLMGDANNGNN